MSGVQKQKKNAGQSGVNVRRTNSKSPIFNTFSKNLFVIHSQYAKVNAVVEVEVLFLFFYFKDKK